MAHVYNRGSKHEPQWYVRFRDSDGRWVSRPCHQQTKAQAEAYAHQIAARIAAGKVGIETPDKEPPCRDLMETWAASLTNRNAADDRSRLGRHLLPAFGDRALKDITQPIVMRWLDRLRADGKLAPASMRHCLNLLSRFFSWAIERGHTTINPVKQIPTGKRPQQPHKRDTPWLADDAIVRRIIHALPEPVGLMFYLGNCSGLRTGEIAGLRMADLDGLAEGAIRVRFSYAGPLKEDKAGIGKVKWAPAPDDAPAFLGPWLAQRRAQGAGPEDFAFPCANRGASHYRKEYIEGCWERVAKSLSLSLTWYQATRHSFVTRSLAGGATLDEVSSAVGHSSPVVTRRYYDHHVRRTFSAALRGGLGLGGPGTDAQVIPLRREVAAGSV